MPSNLPRLNRPVVSDADPASLDAAARRIAPGALTRRQPLRAHLTAAGRADAAARRAGEAVLLNELSTV